MAAINMKRVWLGTLVGGVFWTIWTVVFSVIVQGPNYQAGQEEALLRYEPQYSYFLPVWILALFAMTFLGAWLYAHVRSSAGAGAGTALKVGAIVGFAAGFPMNFSFASWSTLPRIVPFWWMVDLLGGGILAVFLAAWLYRE